MTLCSSGLAIDFGHVGYARSKHPFRVRLNSTPLSELIRATEAAHRLYELLLIDRPGDVWEYVSVVLEDIPPRVAERIKRSRENAQSSPEWEIRPWPEDEIPFPAFDRLFFWAWDDTDPEDEAWLGHRNTPVMRNFAQQTLAIARVAQRKLEWNDPLLRHVAAGARSSELSYCYLDRSVAVKKSRERGPNAATHTPDFYRKLGDLLRAPQLASIAYRADGDYQVLRMMATEQRRRASRTGHNPGHAMRLSALVNNTVSNEAWDSEIWFFEEGLAHGDLFIEGGGIGDGNLGALVESGRIAPGSFILSHRDEGDLKGFEVESGSGWVLYRQQRPDPRRLALERIEDRRGSALGPIISFERNGSTLFEHDKAVIVVGQTVAISAQDALATIISEWQRHRGKPLLIALGDGTPFDISGCKDVLSVPHGMNDDLARTRWLDVTLDLACPWIDAVIALEPPPWAARVLAKRTERLSNPWSPWIVATEGAELPRVDCVLDGDLAEILVSAHRRAKGARWRR